MSIRPILQSQNYLEGDNREGRCWEGRQRQGAEQAWVRYGAGSVGIGKCLEN